MLQMLLSFPCIDIAGAIICDPKWCMETYVLGRNNRLVPYREGESIARRVSRRLLRPKNILSRVG